MDRIMIGGFKNPILTGATAVSMNVDFIASTQTPDFGATISFTNLSDPTPLFNFWDFGDGSFSTASNPIKLYEDSGTYSVTLNACNEVSGGIETKTDYIFVEAPDLSPILIYHRDGTAMVLRELPGDLSSQGDIVWTNNANITNRDLDYHKETDRAILSYRTNTSNGRIILIDASNGNQLSELAAAWGQAVCFHKNGTDIITGSVTNNSNQVSRHTFDGTSWSLVWTRIGGNQTRQVRYIEEDDTIGFTGFANTGRYTDDGTLIWSTGVSDSGSFRLSPDENTILIREAVGTNNRIRNYTTGALISEQPNSVRNFSGGSVLSNGDYVYFDGTTYDVRRVNGDHTSIIWETKLFTDAAVSPSIERSAGMDVDLNDNIYVSYRNDGKFFVALFDSNGNKINEIELTNITGDRIMVASKMRRGICRT